MSKKTYFTISATPEDITLLCFTALEGAKAIAKKKMMTKIGSERLIEILRELANQVELRFGKDGIKKPKKRIPKRRK